MSNTKACSLPPSRIRASKVDFLSDYRHGLPLWRSLPTHPCDLLHLHWPEAYYSRAREPFEWARRLRFPLDLALATRHRPLVVTSHNLLPHHIPKSRLVLGNVRYALRRASFVIAHSEAAKARLGDVFSLRPERCRVIPHGDLSPSFGVPVSQTAARAKLGLGPGKVCLLFGTVSPYKGIEEVISFWHRESPDVVLAIVGKPSSAAYADSLARIPSIITRFERLEDDQLALWLSAADCTVFNYKAVLTSGAACLARSWGLPILIPSRLDTVDFDEPSPLVFRFKNLDADFAGMLTRALAAPGNFQAASDWRERTSWETVARATAEVYRQALERR